MPGQTKQSNRNYGTAELWLTEENLFLIQSWCRDGLTDEQISAKMGIAYKTLCTWKTKYQELKEAMRVGKEFIDYQVENALLKAALGFTTKEIKVTTGKTKVNGVFYSILKEETTREIAPSVPACMAWLCNRQRDKWKRDPERLALLEAEAEENKFQLVVVRGKDENEKGLDTELSSVNDKVEFSKKTKEKLKEEERLAKNKKEALDLLEEENNKSSCVGTCNSNLPKLNKLDDWSEWQG